MEEKRLEGAAPDALRAVRAAGFDDFDPRLAQFDRILRTDADAAAAEVAQIGFDFYEKHERSFLQGTSKNSGVLSDLQTRMNTTRLPP